MSKNVPMIFCSNRNTRAFWSRSSPPFRDCIIKFPFVRSYLFLFPLPFIVIPFVSSSYIHPHILLPFELFQPPFCVSSLFLVGGVSVPVCFLAGICVII